MLTVYHRVLLVCIKYLACCPCSCCDILKVQIPMMGTTADHQWQSHDHQDDYWLHMTIARMRQWIFEKGIGVNNAKLKAVLDIKSLLPTMVFTITFQVILDILTCLTRVGFPLVYQVSVSTTFQCLSQTFFTNLSSACGKPFLPTFSKFCMLQATIVFRFSTKGSSYLCSLNPHDPSLTLLKVPSSSNIWSGYDSMIWEQCISNEEASWMRLWGHSPGVF